MPFQEDFSQFLGIDEGFASQALLTPAVGDPYKVVGIMSMEYTDIDTGFAGVSGACPHFECAEEDVAGIDYDDFLKVAGKNYRIKGFKPDGTGWMVLVLEVQE